MSKAAKCDKCGVLFEGAGTHLKLQSWPLGGRLREGWYPDELDLCDKCANALARAIAAWWKEKSDAH